MPTQLRLSESQQLHDGLQDPLLNAGLQAFVAARREERTTALVQAVRQHVRDTLKESRIAGEVEVYDNLISDLRRFALEQLRSAGE